MKIYKSKLSKIGSQFSLRLDSKYRGFWDGDRTIMNLNQTKTKRVGDFFKPIQIKKVTKRTFEDESFILNISDTVPRYGKLEESIQLTDEIGSDKTILDEAEFIVSKLCMSKGYIFSNESQITNLIGSTELIPYVRRDASLNLAFIRNLLLTDEYLKIYEYLETGKTPSQKRVNPIDFLNLPIPDVSPDLQNVLGKKILRAEKHISKLSSFLQARNSIIDEVFSTEFNINFNEIKKISRPSTFKQNLSDMTKSFDLRNSTKYFAKVYKNLEAKLQTLPLQPLKHYLDIPIKLGESISPSDYDDKGEAYYVSMSTIKSWSFDKLSSNKVSEEYFEENKKSASVKKGDIIIARSGEGTIGKVALIEEDFDGIFADFTMRVRLSNKYDKRFFYYYFCSSIFQLLIEKEKKGLGNNTNIFPRQLKFFPVISVDVKEQERIADIIENKLSKIRRIENLVQLKRQRIDKMIRATL